MPAGITKANLFLEQFSEVLRRDSGEPAWLRRRRESAMERFLTLGVPTARNEEYKYTDLSRLTDGSLLFAPPSASTATVTPRYLSASGKAVQFGDGLAVLGSGQANVQVLSLQQALQSDPELLADSLAKIAAREDHALCALNTAYFQSAVVVIARAGAVIEKPIHLVFGDGQAGRHPRVLIVAGQSSSIRVVETYLGSGAYWRNGVTEIRAGANARVDHCRAQLESDEAFHTGLLQGVQDRDSFIGSFSLSFGAKIARNDISTRLGGTGCDCSLDGLYAVRDSQLVDHHTAIDHAMAHCHSHQLYKGVLDGRAKGVFNGKIFVRQDAQKTDAVQSNKNLLLSDKAEVNTKPQLEIDANDVRCTHGATIGQLDATAAFYLRSRGISAAHARNILTYAFAADALDRVPVKAVKAYFESLLLARFAPEDD